MCKRSAGRSGLNPSTLEWLLGVKQVACWCELTSGRTEAWEPAGLTPESRALLSQITESRRAVLSRQTAEGGATGGGRKAGNVEEKKKNVKKGEGKKERKKLTYYEKVNKSNF